MSTVYFDEFAAGSLTQTQDQTFQRFRLPANSPNVVETEIEEFENVADADSTNRANRRDDQFAMAFGIALLVIGMLCLLPLAGWAADFAAATISSWQPGEALNSVIGNSLF